MGREVDDKRQALATQAFRTGLVARLASIAAGFATVPLALSSLGTEGFGVWSVITSSISMMAFLDFGIGNGAMGRVTESLARNDEAGVRSIVRHAYTLLISIALCLICATLALYWTGMLEELAVRSGSFLRSKLGLGVAFVIGYALVIPASFVQRLLFAYQRAAQATLLQLAFSIVYLAAAVVGSYGHLTLNYFVLAYVASMVLVYGAGTVLFLRNVAPSGIWRSPFQTRVALGLLRDAGLFFVLQSTVAAVYSSDQLILSSFSSPADVTVYATTAKLFSIVILVNGMMLGPMWPAYIDASSRGDLKWVRQAYYRIRRKSGQLSWIGAGALAFLAAPVVDLWTVHRVHVPPLLSMSMAIWVVLEGYGQCMAMLLNAMRIIRLQLVVAVAFLLIGTAVKIYLAARLGLYGPIVGTIASFVLVVAIYETYFIKRTMDSIDE